MGCNHNFVGATTKGKKLRTKVLQGLEGLTFPCGVYEMHTLVICSKCGHSQAITYEQLIRSAAAKKYQRDLDKYGF